MIVHPAQSVEWVGALGGLGAKRCTRCGARLGWHSTTTVLDDKVTCRRRDHDAFKRATLRSLLDEHEAARVDLERAQSRVVDAWAAVQRFLEAGAS